MFRRRHDKKRPTLSATHQHKNRQEKKNPDDLKC